jgi:hypothetical protein
MRLTSRLSRRRLLALGGGVVLLGAVRGLWPKRPPTRHKRPGIPVKAWHRSHLYQSHDLAG